MDKTWITVEQISQRLQVNPQTVRRWLRHGELKGVLIGDRAGYRVHPDDLMEFLRKRGYADAPAQVEELEFSEETNE